MRILILGATGRTGRELVRVGLARGHTLTAFVRSPDKIPERSERLLVTPGDPLDSLQLSAALPGHDAVLSALGPSPREAFRRSDLLTRAAESTVQAMQQAGVQRLVIVSAAVLFPGSGLYVAFFRWLLREHARDLTTMEAAVERSPLAWTIARPPRLVSSDASAYTSRSGALPEDSRSMSFRAVASFMLDCLEQHGHVREVVGLGAAKEVG